MSNDDTETSSIWVKDGIVQACTSSFASLVGRRDTDIIGQPLTVLFFAPPSDNTDFGSQLPPLSPDGSPQFVVLKSGAHLPICVEMSRATIRPNADRPIQINFEALTFENLKQMRDDLRRNSVGVDVWNVGLFEHHHLSGTIYCSKRLREMYGFSAEGELDFMKFVAVIHPDDRDTENAKRSHDPHGDGIYEKKYRIIRHDGEIRWMHARTQTTFGDVHGENRALYTTGTIFDITEQHRLGTAVEDSKQRLSDILNSLPSVVLGINRDFKVTQWNRAAEIQTGIPEQTALGQTIDQVYPMLVPDIDNIQESMQQQVTIERTRVPWTHDGDMRFFNICITPLHNAKTSEAVVRIDDVSEQVRFEEMLVHSEKLLSVGGLAAGMAHEINNPLAAVLQNAQVMATRINPDLPINRRAAQKVGVSMEKVGAYLDERHIPRMLDAVTEAGNRAATIVKNMLGFVRISTNQKTKCFLHELIDTTLELALNDYDLARKSDFRKIKIQRDYERDTRPVVVDPGKIQQVLLNLLTNAGQALFDARTPSPQITIRVRSNKDMVRVELEDNGPGISKAVSHRIFEPFFTTKQVGAGTGLGLSISYYIIVQEHKGSIRAENRPSGGARFIIELP